MRIASESGIEVTSQEFKDLPHVFQVFDALEAEGKGQFSPREHSCQTFARVANVIIV